MSLNNQHTELRTGLTTGTCAAAVAKAAVYMLIHQCEIQHIQVLLPTGNSVVLEIVDCSLNRQFVRCATIKDAGDDPDITNGVEIFATASYTDGNAIIIKGGKGIGIVTKPGLAVEVGKPAINPTPLKMITESIAEVIPNKTGVEVEISIPQGEVLAQKTFNPKLGILGGLSVLGTTGIVKPMSEEALKDSLVIKLNQLAALGYASAILTPGNYSQSYSKQNLSISEDKTVLTSNYIGYMLEHAVRQSFKKVVLIGHLGKLVKVAGGIFHTHSKIADARNEILASNYFWHSNDALGFKMMMESNTTEEAIAYVNNQEFWQYLAGRIKIRSQEYVHNALQVEVVLLSQKAGLLAITPNAKQIIEEVHDGR